MKSISIIQSVLFIVGTLFFLYISKNSLLNLKAHGFYRFFVFDFCLLLVLVNIPFWISKPFSILQIISWTLLLVSIYLVFQSISFLKKLGGSKEREGDSTNYKFENTINLVKDGVYKYIRHPMYSSLFFLSLGTLFKNISVFTILLTVFIILFLILTAKFEEKENINFFGNSYMDYMKGTKMFVPYIF